MSASVNYRTDFKIFEVPAEGAEYTFSVPFRFSYYTTGATVFVASHCNGEYNNCELLEDGRLKVTFDNHGLAPGRVLCRREFYLTDEDYNDGICNAIFDTTTDIFLSLRGSDLGDITVELPPFYQKGDPFKWEDMTAEQRDYFIEQVGADVVATNEAVIAAEAQRVIAENERSERFEGVMQEATTQAGYAKAQGDYAQKWGNHAMEQGDYAKEQGDYAKTTKEQIEAAESLRVNAEKSRNTNESEREQKEINRNSNELDRQAKESERSSAEAQRVANEEQRQANTTEAISNANTAADRANAIADELENVREEVATTEQLEQLNETVSSNYSEFVNAKDELAPITINFDFADVINNPSGIEISDAEYTSLIFGIIDRKQMFAKYNGKQIPIVAYSEETNPVNLHIHAMYGDTNVLYATVGNSRIMKGGITPGGGSGGIAVETDPIFSASAAASITADDIAKWSGKQDAIADLDAIRSGAAKGATAVQPANLATVATSGNYNDLSDKPQISTNIYNESAIGKLADAYAVKEYVNNTKSDWREEDTSKGSYIENKTHYIFNSTSKATFSLSENTGDVIVYGLQNRSFYQVYNYDGAKSMTFEFIEGRELNFSALCGPPVKVVCSAFGTDDFCLRMGSSNYGISALFYLYDIQVEQLDEVFIPNLPLTKLEEQVATKVLINGEEKVPNTVGVVDLGTVITSHQDISGKQDKLVSGTNIKTINGESILGEGDIAISGGGVSPEYVDDAIAKAITSAINASY